MDNLQSEKPAIGILKSHDFGDSIFYSVPCQCGNPDDMIDFSLELEADSWNIVLNTAFTPKTAYWNRLVDDNGNFESSWLWSIDNKIRSLINGLYSRIIVTYEVWTTGYVKYYQSTIMSEQQALNYAAAINQSIQDLRKFKKDLEKNQNNRKEKIETDAEDGC